MLSRIEGMPEGVLAIEATGEVTSGDYEAVLVPAVADFRAKGEKVRFLYVLGSDFDGYSGGALWDDAKVGMSHWGIWERIAVVTDAGWLQGAIKAFGVLMPGEVKVFPLDQRDDAEKWIAE